jgi:hypothetical protein
LAIRDPAGASAPSKNAPNSAWMPMYSVISVETSNATTTALMPCRVRPSASCDRIQRTMKGRNKTSMAAM